MANNAYIFDGALCGAAGGVHERWITDTNPDNYLAVRNAVVAFANTVDSLIPPNASVTASDGELIASICGTVLAGRYLDPTGSSASLAQAIVALYNAVKGQLIPVLTPAVTGDGIGMYVNRLTTLPTALQNGSSVSPFATIAQAIAALPTGGVIMIMPGDYSAEPALNLGASNWTIESIDVHVNYVYGGPGINQTIVPAITGTGNVNLISIRVAGSVTGFARICGDACWFTGALTASAHDYFDCRFTNTVGTITVVLGMGFTDCELDSVTFFSLAANPVTRLINCLLATTFTINYTGPTAPVLFDGYTNWHAIFIAAGFSITGAVLTVIDTSGPNVSAPTPIVATGALGVINIATLQSGGTVILQPSANYNIDGFTAKGNGFWFDLFVDSTNDFIGTINHDVGGTTTSIRCPGSAPIQIVRGFMIRFRWQLNRWRTESYPLIGQITRALNQGGTTGALGVVDVSQVPCGGSLFYALTGNANIDGFTARPEGFWFDLIIDGTVVGNTMTLNQEIGVTTTSIRNPAGAATVMQVGKCVRMRYQTLRWRVVD